MIEKIINLVLLSRFLHYFLFTGFGFLINIFSILILTEFIFGKENYIYSYFIGSFLNLIWNFIFNLKVVFKIKNEIIVRLINFFSYHISMTLLQSIAIVWVVKLIGVKYYLFSIIFVIGSFFIFGFLVSKYFIFKKKNK